MESDFGRVSAVPQLRPVLTCRETNPTSWAVFVPLVCQLQLPKMTWNRVGETPWDSAKSGPGGLWTIPPLKSGSSSSLWFHWEGLSSHSPQSYKLLTSF